MPSIIWSDIINSVRRDPDYRLDTGETPLEFKTLEGDSDVVIELIEAGANPNHFSHVPPLHAAILNHRGNSGRALIECLLKSGADPNLTWNSQTPLYVAVSEKRYQIVKLLLEFGADPEQESNGLTPLAHAVYLDHVALVEALLEHGADANRLTGEDGGAAVLLHALKAGNFHLIPALLEAGADPNKSGFGGLLPLHRAVDSADLKTIKALLDGGARPNEREPDNISALMVGIYEKREAVVSLLIEYGADVNALGPNSLTPIKLALDWCEARLAISIGVQLLKAGADPHAVDDNGFSAYDTAVEKQYIDLLSLKRLPGHSNDLSQTGGDQPTHLLEPKPETAAPVVKESPIVAKGQTEPSPVSSNLGKRKNSDWTSSLKALVGQELAKDVLSQLIAIVEVNQERVQRQLPPRRPCLHSVFTGNPGTGKKTLAACYATQLHRLGILSKGHMHVTSPSEMVDSNVGRTARKTQEVVAKAIGGVLFIEEAHTLKQSTDDAVGAECLDALYGVLDQYAEDLIVVLSGPNDEMRKMLQRDPRMKARFLTVIPFHDLNDRELGQIFDRLCAAEGMRVSEDVRIQAISHVAIQRKGSTFGNAWEVKRVFERALARQSMRLSGSELASLSTEQLTSFDVTDFEDETTIDDMRAIVMGDKRPALERLQGLVGLENVKDELRELSNLMRVTRRRTGSVNLGSISLHMVFSGNPGTGKTTVARLLGEIFRNLGVLSSGHVVEVDRSTLVGGYLGQTAIRTKEKIDEALGGILFVDEAYMLHRRSDGPGDSYGQEALDTIVKYMEDYRDQLVVIFAGYPKEMQNFLKSNPGLRSRIFKVLEFPDFSIVELEHICTGAAEERGYTLSHAAVDEIMTELDEQRRIERHFANARTVRNVLEAAYRKHASRVVQLADLDSLDEQVLNTIEAVDVRR